jgi:hypothetical protein
VRSGELVRPNIRLLEPLAQGGMGELWTAWHEGLSVEVAVKLIDPTYVSDEVRS